MALVDFMGDAPAFMSYRRQPSLDLTNLPERKAPVKPEYQSEDFKFDVKGNPGDKQFVYDQQQSYNSELKNLYNQYGGEMDWVVTDPKYKQIANQNRWAVYDQQVAEQNKVDTDNRLNDFRSKESGQKQTDIELEFDPATGLARPKLGNTKSGFGTKGDYTNYVISTPQAKEREDGTVGLEKVNFDLGTGSFDDFHSTMNKMFTDGLGLNKQGGYSSNQQKQAVTEGLDFAVESYTKQGGSNLSNYAQLNDAVDYLMKYGFNDNENYYLWNSFYQDVQSGKSFKMPKMDEKGEIKKDAKGNVEYDQVYLDDASINDDAALKTAFNIYVHNRIVDYSEKFRRKETEQFSESSSSTKNFDPRTGQPIVDETMPRWASVVANEGPAGPEFSKTETYPGKDGKTKEHQVIVYNQSNFGTGIEQANKDLMNKTIGSISWTGDAFIGKAYQKLDPAIAGMKISKVGSVRQVPNPDGKGVIWVARTLVVADDDSDFGDTKFWNPRTNKKENISGATWGIWDWNSQDAEGTSIVTIPRADAEKAGYFINGDEGYGWSDAGDHDVKGIWIDVPINENKMLSWDEYNVGESARKGSEQIQVGAASMSHDQYRARENVKKQGVKNSTF